MRRHRTARGRERGVGLIEVLVAVVVLSIGFLAAGGMQIQAMRNSQEAYQRSQAGMSLDDMMDRMRHNAAGVDAGAYDGLATGATSAPDCWTVPCTMTQLAQRDMADWSTRLEPGGSVPPLLPPASDGSAAQGTISMPLNGVYTLRLAWEAIVDGELETLEAISRFVP